MALSQPTRAELMSAYLDEELPEEEARAFEEFLAGSPSAREELAELRRVVSLVAALPTVDAPADFCEKVSRRVRRRSSAPWDSRLSVITFSFQILSVVVILTAAALLMMIELDRASGPLERDRPNEVVSPQP